MPWFKVDDKFHSHPKVMDLSLNALGLWTLAGSWSADYLTDGEVRRGQLRRLGGTDEEISELVDAGLWEATETGWMFKDWHDYQPTKEAVEADKEVAKRRWAMNNNPELRKAVRGRDGDLCRYCGKRVNWSDRRSPEGGTYDHVHPMSAGGDESPENIVVACRDCNVRKGARTPAQAGLTLLPPRTNLDTTQNTSRESSSHTKPPVPVPDPVPNKDLSSKRRKPSVALPDSWAPNEKHREKAAEEGLDLNKQAERFRLHAETNDRRAANWNAAFTNWLNKAADFKPPANEPSSSYIWD